MHPQPQREHQWLEQLIGQWTWESDCAMGPGQPHLKLTGTESVRSLGGIWTIGEWRGQMPDGGTADSIITLGFDPAKGHYVGSWVGSPMTFLWIYKGTLDPTERILTLAAQGPNFADGGKTTVLFHDVITIIDKDHRTLTGKMQDADGGWHEFMTTHYHRKK
jgi:hypothetical protein